MGFLFTSWIISSIVCTVIWLFAVKHISDEECDPYLETIKKPENLILFTLSIVFPFMVFLGFSIAITWNYISSKIRGKARRILRSILPYMPRPGEQNTYYTETISTKDLKFIEGLNEEIVKVDKEVMNAVIDELMKRSLKLE